MINYNNILQIIFTILLIIEIIVEAKHFLHTSSPNSRHPFNYILLGLIFLKIIDILRIIYFPHFSSEQYNFIYIYRHTITYLLLFIFLLLKKKDNTSYIGMFS